MKIRWVVVLLSLAMAGCAELHQRDDRFIATGVSANILFIQLPGNPMEMANAKVPPGAEVTNINGSPNEINSVPGFLSRLIGFGWAQIGGKVPRGYRSQRGAARRQANPAFRPREPRARPQPRPSPRPRRYRPPPGDYIE